MQCLLPVKNVLCWFFFRKVILMSDFDYNSDEFEHNIDDPDPVLESSEGYEHLETLMNITPPPPQTIDII